MHHSKRPSPTAIKKGKDPNKISRQSPRVIQVNRDVATMVDEVSQEQDMQSAGGECWGPGELGPPTLGPRPRTYSDSFVRNTSEELLVGPACEACGHSSGYNCQQFWNNPFETENSIDLLCNCNSERDSFPQDIPKTREKLISDFENLSNRHSYLKTNNSYHRSLDRKHVKTKSVASFIPRHIPYANPSSSFVKKIKRNLSSLKKIGGDSGTKKNNHGVPLSELPLDFPQRKSDSLVRHLKVSDRGFNANCIFSSSNFNTIPQTDFVNIDVPGEFDYSPDMRTSSLMNTNFKLPSKGCKNETTGVHRKNPLNVSSINVTLDDRYIDRFCSQIEMPPRRIMSSSDLWKDRILSNYSMSTEPIVYSNYDGRESTLETMEGNHVCAGSSIVSGSGVLGGGGGGGGGRQAEVRTFKRGDETECDMIMLETKQDLTGYHHCLCDNHTRSHDNKCPGSYFHLQDDKPFPPAPDVTAWAGPAGPGPGGLGGHGGPGGLGAGCPPLKGAPPWPQPISQSSSATGSSSRINSRSKQWSLVLALVLVVGAAGVAGPIALRASAGAPLAERLELAARLLHETPLIDGHNDLPWNIRKFLHNKLKDFKFDEDLRTIPPWSTSQWSHTDLPRLKQGRVSAQFWAAYVPCESQHRDAVQLTFEQIDLIRRLTEQYQPTLTLCTTAEDIRAAHAAGRVCSLVGVEGGHALGGSLGVLRSLHRVGVRYLTLTSTCNTPWADCAMSDTRTKPEHGGLTPFGKVIVKEMNRLGIIVDLSHVSIKTMKDAIAVSKAPVMFSHSSAHALCNSSRNVPDPVLRRLANNRGLVMVNFYSKFLSCNSVATVQDAIAHINHIKEVAGVDNVGLGAGYDGINYTPRGLEDVSSYPLLFAELMANGWSMDELKKLAGLNLLRVMEAVEKVSAEQKASGILPYEDTMTPRPPDPYNCSSQDLF